MRAVLLAACALAATPAWAEEPAQAPLTVGTLVNGTSGGVIVGPEEGIRARLLDVLASEGLEVVAPVSAVRDKIDAGNARFILTGNVVKQACHQEVYWTGCRWRILWSVLDTEQGQVIVEATGVGEASVPQANPTTAMYVEIIARSVLPLARSPELRTLLAEAGDAPPLTGWNRDVGARRCTTEPRSLPKDTRALQPALFSVSNERGRADGVIFSPDGLAITGATPLLDHRIATATRADGSTTGLTVLRVDERTDIALVVLEGVEGICAPVRSAPTPVGEAVFALGTRGDEGWGLRTGIVTSTRSFSNGLHVTTDAKLEVLSNRATLFDSSGTWVASAPPRDGHAIVASAALTGLGIVPSEEVDPLANIDRHPRRIGEPVRLELGGPAEAALQPPIGPGRPATTLAQAPGGTDMAVGGAMVGVATLVGVPTVLLWVLDEGTFDVSPQQRVLYGTVSGVSAAMAIGGGLLVYRGVKKAEAAEEVQFVVSPGGVGLRGRF